MITDTHPEGPNRLRQSEAEARAAQISEVAYVLDLSLQRGSPEYQGDLRLRFRHRTPGEGVFLDFTGREIEMLEVNGRSISAPVWASHRLQLEGALLQESNTVRVRYTNAYDHTGAGFHQFTDPEDGQEYLYTHFEPYEAHRLLPCFDQPDIKASFQLTVTAPADWDVITNSPEESRTTAADGRIGRAFAPTPPISSYLYAVVAGPYDRYTDAYEHVPLGLFCRRSLSKVFDADELFTITKQGLQFFGEYFACPYPFAKYDQIFVPEFNAGAMENAGAVTFADRFVFRDPPTDLQRLNRAEVVLHEMAHMWFGDLVTMQWWNDLWLNESFATYMAYLALGEATRFKGSWKVFHSRMKGWAYHQDQLITTHPIAGDVPDTDATFLNFDGITYGKGAAVLKQLAAAIGKDGFREGMRHYFRTYAWRNATLAEFLGALEHGARRDLRDWSQRWLETAGLNTLTPAWRATDGRITAFAIEQSAPPDHPQLRPHALELALIAAGRDGAPLIRAVLPLTIDGARTPVEAAVGAAAPACIFPNYNDLAYAKVGLDPQSLAFVRERLERFADPLLRLLLWRTLWDMVRDQQLRSTDYLALVREKIRFESDLELIESILRNAGMAVYRFVPEERLVAEAEALLETLWERLFAAADNDRRSVWARAAIGMASGEASIRRLLALVDQGTAIPGFDLDQEMRWSLAVKQIAHGLPGGEARLAAEQARDPSDRGRQAVERARTAAPDPAVKAAAWERFRTDREASLHMISAAMIGFTQRQQRDLLAPYVDRFFAEVREIFRTRDKDFAQSYFGALFPHDRPEDAVIAQTEALIAALEAEDTVLRRTALEDLDDLRRAHACRAFAAGG